MVQQPLQLSSNLSLYSGDIITIDQSETLLVEVLSEQTLNLKLRKVASAKYLAKHNNFSNLRTSLTFHEFEKALVFTVKINNNGQVSLVATGKYLELSAKDKEFRLSAKETWLTIVKQQDIKNTSISSYEEEIEIISFDESNSRKVNDQKIIVACKSYDNKTANSLEYNFSFNESVQKQYNLTWSTEITFGATIKFSVTPPLTNLGIDGNWGKKSTTTDSFTKSDIKSIQESLKVNCSPWKKTRVKLEMTKAQQTTPFTAKVKRIVGARVYEYEGFNGELTSDNYSESKCLTEEIATKNILIVGWTGSGKSTLAKVLSEDDSFKVSNKSVSGTKFALSSKEFEHQGNFYAVIDNIGFGDAKISEKEVMLRIGQAINSTYQGLSHVLLVFNGRFSEGEKDSLCKLKALKIANCYITLTRSNFDNFENENECQKDRDNMEKESSEVSGLINNCRGLLHINNEDNDSKNESRKLVLNHLHNSCERNPFKPQEWENITVLIEEYFKEKKVLESQKEQTTLTNKETFEQQLDQLEITTADRVKKELQSSVAMNEFTQIIEVGYQRNK